MVVHCGLDYKDYIQHTDEYDEFFKGGGFGIFKGATEKHSEYPSIRGPDMISAISRSNVETLEKYCSIRDSMIFENVQRVESRMSLIISHVKKVLLTSGIDSFVKAYDDDRHGENNAVYGTLNDTDGIEILITGHFVTDSDGRAEGQDNRNFLANVLEYLHIHNPVKFRTEFALTNRASVGVKPMWHIHPTEQWIDEVVKFMSERQLSLEDSKFMIAFFSSMDNDFVRYFKSNQSKISSFSGRSFHIFTPLIYEGNTIPDEHWRYMRNEFKALGIPSALIRHLFSFL